MEYESPLQVTLYPLPILRIHMGSYSDWIFYVILNEQAGLGAGMRQ